MMQVAEYVKGSSLSEVKEVKHQASTGGFGGEMVAGEDAKALGSGVKSAFSTLLQDVALPELEIKFLAKQAGITMAELMEKQNLTIQGDQLEEGETPPTENSGEAVEKPVENKEAVEDPFTQVVTESKTVKESVEVIVKEETEEVAKEVIEIKTPMLVYVPNSGDFLRELKLSDSDAKALMKKAKEAGIHFIFHLSTTSMGSLSRGLGKYLKEMTRTGFVGLRSVEQRFVTVKKNHGEPPMADGEHTYFDKRLVERVRTIGISE